MRDVETSAKQASFPAHLLSSLHMFAPDGTMVVTTFHCKPKLRDQLVAYGVCPTFFSHGNGSQPSHQRLVVLVPLFWPNWSETSRIFLMNISCCEQSEPRLGTAAWGGIKQLLQAKPEIQPRTNAAGLGGEGRPWEESGIRAEKKGRSWNLIPDSASGSAEPKVLAVRKALSLATTCLLNKKNVHSPNLVQLSRSL